MKHRNLVIKDNSANMQLMVYPLNAYGHHAMPPSDGHGGLAMTGGREKLLSAGFDGMIEEFLSFSHASGPKQARTPYLPQ